MDDSLLLQFFLEINDTLLEYAQLHLGELERRVEERVQSIERQVYTVIHIQRGCQELFQCHLCICQRGKYEN